MARIDAALVKGTWASNTRRENIGVATTKFTQTILSQAKSHPMVVWVDDYSKWRCSRNVAHAGSTSVLGGGGLAGGSMDRFPIHGAHFGRTFQRRGSITPLPCD